jgi:hypothetical protein
MPGDLIVSVPPGSNGSQGLGYVAPGSDPQLQGAGLAATVQNVATLLNTYSPAPTQAHTSVVDQHGPQNPPSLTSQDIVRTVSVGLAAAPVVKSLLVAAGASATVPAAGWVAAGIALLAAGAVTAIHYVRARKGFERNNSGEVLYIDQIDWSKIEDAILNGIQKFQEHASPWVPRPHFRYDGDPTHCCSGKNTRGNWIHFYPSTIPLAWHQRQCFDIPSIGVRGCKPLLPFGAVVSASGGIVLSDLVRVGAHAMLLSVYGKGAVNRTLVDSLADYIVKSWQAREYVSQRIGDLIRASRDLPRPAGFESYAYYSAHPQGADALRTTGWFPVWATSAAAGWSAAMQFGVFHVDDYWRNGNPINVTLLQQLYFLYTWALYVGLSWDFIYRYLTGSASELPVWALVSSNNPRRPDPLVSPSGNTGVPSDSSDGVVSVTPTSSGSTLLGLPAWLLPVLAVGLVLIKRKR